MVTVRFTFSGAETQRMLRYMLLRSRAPLAMLAAGVAILAVAIVVGKPLWYAIAGAELLGWAGLVTVMPRASTRTRQSEHTLSFSEDGVLAANAHGSQRFEWSHWRLWTRTGDLYLLRGPRGVFTFVPGRAFASEADEGRFRELLARHLASPRGRPAASASG